MAKAKQAGFIEWHRDATLFDLEAYRHYEQVQNGDLNWVVPGKLLAFAGPSEVSRLFYGYKTLVPEDYHEVFKTSHISDVVRLNNKVREVWQTWGAGSRGSASAVQR